MSAGDIISEAIEEELSLGGDAKSAASYVMSTLADNGLAIIHMPTVAHKGPHDTDAKFFRQVADRMDRVWQPISYLGGSNVRRAVIQLLELAADAGEVRP